MRKQLRASDLYQAEAIILPCAKIKGIAYYNMMYRDRVHEATVGFDDNSQVTVDLCNVADMRKFIKAVNKYLREIIQK